MKFICAIVRNNEVLGRVIMSNFSEKLKDILSKKGITPYRLSQISGIRQSTLSAILNGVNTPSGKTLQKICNALDVSMAEFDDTPPTFSTNEKTATQLAANDLIKKRPPAESPTDAYADAIFDAMSPEEKEKRLSRFIRSADRKSVV